LGEKETGNYESRSSQLQTLTFSLEFLGDRFELVALDNVALLDIAEVAKLDAAFKA
jgi:hypothetical protein